MIVLVDHSDHSKEKNLSPDVKAFTKSRCQCDEKPLAVSRFLREVGFSG